MTIFVKTIDPILGRASTAYVDSKTDFQAYVTRKRDLRDPERMTDLCARRESTVVTCFPMSIAICLFPKVRIDKKSPTRYKRLPTEFLAVAAALQALLPTQGTYLNNFTIFGKYLFSSQHKQLVVLVLEDYMRWTPIYTFYTDEAAGLPSIKSNQLRLYVLVHNNHAYAITNVHSVIPPSALCKRCGYVRVRLGARFNCLNRHCFVETVQGCKMCEQLDCVGRGYSQCQVLCNLCNFFLLEISSAMIITVVLRLNV